MHNIKKKVKEKIRLYSKEEYLDGYIESEFLTGDGKADIFLKITNKEDLYDSRTDYHQLDLNKRIYEHIDHKSSMLKNDIPLKLRVTGISFTEEEQEEIEHLISEHYAIELYKIQKKYRIYRNRIINLLLVGILFLLIYGILEILFPLVFVSEVLIFLFSFTLWEAFDTLIYTLSEIKLEREAITQRLLIDVIFDKKRN